MKRIPLWARDGSIRAYALVDDEDFEELSKWRWCVVGPGYAGRTSKGRRGEQRAIYMHRVLLGGMSDHINGDTLDNRRSNLRPATPALNAQNKRGLLRSNTSGYRGVMWDKRRSRWTARAELAGKKYHLGSFDTPEAADRAARRWRAEHMPYSEDARSISCP